MIKRILNILGFSKPTIDYKSLIDSGAIIVDVRTKGEYMSGHIKNSLNIPVDSINQHISKLKDKNKAIITCCASGMRSAAAKSILKSNGIEQVHNGGAWHSLQRKINN